MLGKRSVVSTHGAQGFADRTNAWTDSRREAKADKAKGQVWDPKGITGALQGNKIGNLGVNLDNSKMLQEREEERKAKAEEKHAEREAKANAELEAKSTTEQEIKVEPEVKVDTGQEAKVESEASSKTEQEAKVEPEKQLAEESSKESEAARDPEQERYETYWRSKEGPDGDLPPGMTREDYERYQLALGKVDAASSKKSDSRQTREEQIEYLVMLNGGKYSVTIDYASNRMRYDLKGKAHDGVPTPHKQEYQYNYLNGERRSITRTSKKTEPITKEDIRLIRRYLER